MRNLNQTCSGNGQFCCIKKRSNPRNSRCPKAGRPCQKPRATLPKGFNKQSAYLVSHKFRTAPFGAPISSNPKLRLLLELLRGTGASKGASRANLVRTRGFPPHFGGSSAGSRPLPKAGAAVYLCIHMHLYDILILQYIVYRCSMDIILCCFFFNLLLLPYQSYLRQINCTFGLSGHGPSTFASIPLSPTLSRRPNR